MSVSVNVSVSVSVTADLYTCIPEKKVQQIFVFLDRTPGHLFTHCLHVGILYGAFITMGIYKGVHKCTCCYMYNVHTYMIYDAHNQVHHSISLEMFPGKSESQYILDVAGGCMCYTDWLSDWSWDGQRDTYRVV